LNTLSMKAPDIHTTHVALPQIYAYTTPEIARHQGWVKIGYTEKQSVEDRVKQQCHTAGLDWHIEWSGNAVYESSTQTFHDTDFHAYLTRLGIERDDHTEWFHIAPQEAHYKFFEFRQNRGIIKGKPVQGYQLRDSQEQAVSKTITSFNDHPEHEYLWNAKPRFGKTLAVYDLCLRMKFGSVLVVTNRPAIADSWYQDYLKFVGDDNYLFVSRVDALIHPAKPGVPPCLTRQQYVERIKQPGCKTKRCIEFVSLQDLKSRKQFDGHYNKLEEVTNLTWDLLVVDEAHEGVDTYKTDMAFDQIHRRHTLHLSGTPFKALANEKFSANAIFNWTYADECRAKEEWDESRGRNPYADMPRLNMYTYRMSDIVINKVREGVDIDGDTEAYAFDLNEFFRVDRGHFVHDKTVDKWLDALSRQQRYPFSTPALRKEMRHTFWLLNRVDSAKMLAKKLRDTEHHPEFERYEVIVAAGDGKTDDDEVIEDDNSLTRVQQAIAKADAEGYGTITLSVGQLTTGVTIPQWTGVLILSNMKSPAQYMQAAFRAQTPYLYMGHDKQYHRKENAYVFDFDPARTLTNYEEMANGLSADTAAGGGDNDTRKRHIGELLNFFPVIGEDDEGEMMPLNAEDVMRIPRKIRSKEVVRSGFMSNFLFANINNVYGCSQAIIDILNQITPAKAPKDNKVSADDTAELAGETDENGEPKTDGQKVKEVQAALFGEKIYEETEQQLNEDINNAFSQQQETASKKGKSQEEQKLDNVANSLSALLLEHAELQAKEGQTAISKRNQAKAKIRIKEAVNHIIGTDCHQAELKKKELDLQLKENCKGKTTQQQETLQRETQERKRQIDESLQEAIQSKKKEMIEQGAHIIADTQEQQRIEDKKNTVDEMIRDHLRGVSRTIPSFLMGFGDENTTLENFDADIPDAEFLDVTSITKEQFHLLRDGGDFINEETGKKEHSEGHFFDDVVFNDSVREFMALRRKLANYFDPAVKEDIFNYIPPQKTNQIFTPKRVVKQMVDLLEKENPGCFDDPTHTFADLYMKSGQYITEIVRRLYNSAGLRAAYPDDEERLRHIFKVQVYGLAPTECIYRIARRYILGFDERIHIADADHHLRQADALPAAKEGRLQELVDKVFG
jgi:type II restriction enzyme